MLYEQPRGIVDMTSARPARCGSDADPGLLDVHDT